MAKLFHHYQPICSAQLLTQVLGHLLLGQTHPTPTTQVLILSVLAGGGAMERRWPLAGGRVRGGRTSSCPLVGGGGAGGHGCRLGAVPGMEATAGQCGYKGHD